jgi:rhamnosyltransferase
MDFYESVLPILVLYKQNLDDSESLRTLDASLKIKEINMDLYVYDNSPNAQYNEKFAYKNFNIHYKHNGFNAGVSEAYNCGALYAKEQGKKWLLLLDQDTIFPINFLDDYSSAAQSYTDVKIFAPILKTQKGDFLSPCRYKYKRGYWLPMITEGYLSVRKYSPINSGMLINLEAFFEVGGYNSAVKLDFADFQFIERFAEYYTEFYVLGLICIQDFSGYDNSIVKIKHRFGFFCDGARNCSRVHILDGFWYLMVVLRRMLGLILRFKDFSFLGIFIRKYLINSK